MISFAIVSLIFLILNKSQQLPSYYYKKDLTNTSINYDPSGPHDELQFSLWLKRLDRIATSEMPPITSLTWLGEIGEQNDHLWDYYGQRLAMKFYDDYIEKAESVVKNIMRSRWTMYTNLTLNNKKAYENSTILSQNFSLNTITELRKFDWRNFKDENLKRGFLRAISLLGDSGLTDQSKVNKWKKIKLDMNQMYSGAKVLIDGKNVTETNVSLLFQKSRNYSHLSDLWKLWRDSSGKKIGHLYPDYISLSNEATREFGFKDYGQFSRSNFELPDLAERLDGIFSKLENLYKLLHAYVRTKLKEIYPNELSDKLGALPAHLMGDLWAQQWHNIFDDIKPFKNKTLLDVTARMLAKNMTVKDMFLISEEFFVSLGLEPMPELFWNNSVFVKPSDGRDMNCHASAWDFFDGQDFRIKMCSKVSMNDLFVVHHEMGHIQYYMNYRHQPFHFKEGANPGFHEALGDLMTLSVMTPAHLKKIDLIDQLVEDEELEINFLLFSALRNIAFAPFALLVEKWRWNVYAGEIKPKDYNIEWWNLRCKYQGVVPPVERVSDDFDPGAKYHIAAGVPYDRYFVSLILTFQFHQALCRVSNHTGPLHKCDIYQSKEAGNKLKKMMEKGSSEPWTEVLHDLSDGRTDQIDPDAILEYFKPLHDWLLKQNLTVQEWDCENYLDRKNNKVKSYGTRLEELTVKAKSSILITSSASLKFKLNIFFIFICFLIHKIFI